MFSDSSTKDLTEGGRDAILSERAHKPRASFESSLLERENNNSNNVKKLIMGI